MKLKLFSLLLFTGILINAQPNVELKNFINKNTVAIHSVQKNLMMTQSNAEYITTFRLLLQNQEAAVKSFNTNQQVSAYFAMLVRKECLDFLRKNSNKSLTYFEITASETNFPVAKSDKQILSAEDLKTIETLDPLNPRNLNTLTLTVQ